MHRFFRGHIMDTRRLKSRKEVFNLLNNKHHRRKMRKSNGLVDRPRYGIFDNGKCYKINLGGNKSHGDSTNISNASNDIQPSTSSQRQTETVAITQSTCNMMTPADQTMSIAENDNTFYNIPSVSHRRTNEINDSVVRTPGTTLFPDIVHSNGTIGFLTLSPTINSNQPTTLSSYHGSSSFDASGRSYSHSNTNDFELSTPHATVSNQLQCRGFTNSDYSFGYIMRRNPVDSTAASINRFEDYSLFTPASRIHRDETMGASIDISECSFSMQSLSQSPNNRTITSNVSSSKRAYCSQYTDTTSHSNTHKRHCSRNSNECIGFPQLTTEMIYESKTTAARRAHERLFGRGNKPLFETPDLLSFL